MDYFWKNMWLILKKFMIEFFACLGIIATINEVIKLFITIEDKQSIIMNSILISVSVLIVVIRSIPKKEFVFKIKNKDIYIRIVIGDILKQKDTIIVPTNSTFDTMMEQEFISIKSLQGQIQSKYFNNNINTLDSLMTDQLKSIKYNKLTDRKLTKNREYEIGTTIKINYSQRRFYFLANSNINSNGQTINPSMKQITEALSRLWQYISINGHCENLAIPLIGTGRMGIVNSREEVIKQIIFSFIASSCEKKVAPELKIYIRSEDIKKHNINMNEILEYLYYTSKYQYEMIEKSDNIGTGII